MLNFDKFFLRNRGFLRNVFLIFLVISQELFDLQRRTIPHFNPLKELITPLLQCDCCKIGHFWDIRRNIFPIFFTHTLKRKFWNLITWLHLSLPPNITMTTTLQLLWKPPQINNFATNYDNTKEFWICLNVKIETISIGYHDSYTWIHGINMININWT